jgi:hypothetical protein
MREMTTLELVVLLRQQRTKRSTWTFMWEDVARSHYAFIRSEWCKKTGNTPSVWKQMEDEARPSLTLAEDWLKWAYLNLHPED